MKLTISDAFDPCLNLKATATLLDGYYRLAVKVGARVSSDEPVRRAIARLKPPIATLTIGGAFSGDEKSVGIGAGFGW